MVKNIKPILSVYLLQACLAIEGIKHATLLKIVTMCHAHVNTDTVLQLCLLCPPEPWNIPGTALLSEING